MTTPATGRSRTDACDGVTTTFNCPAFRTNGDLKVYLLDQSTDANEAGTLLTEGDDYVIGGGDSANGQASITTLAAQAAGKFIRRWRETSRKQEVQIVANQGLPASTQEGALDRLSFIDEELDEEIGRAIRVPPGEALPDLPDVDARKGLYLAFAADGSFVASAGTGADAGLRVDLAAPDGLSLIGFDPTADYADGSLGAFLKNPVVGEAIVDEAIAKGQLINLIFTGGAMHMRLANGAVADKPAHGFAPADFAMGATGKWSRRGVIPGTTGTAFAAALWLSQAVPGTWQTAAPVNTPGMVSQHVGIAVPGIGVEFAPQLEIVL